MEVPSNNGPVAGKAPSQSRVAQEHESTAIMPAADGLSADMAHKAHVKALNRDYILEPRLGESR